MDFSKDINGKISKAQKGITVIKKLSNILPRNALLTIHEFVWPHLDYDDFVYDQTNNQSVSNKTEAVQYNTALAITNAIKGTSRTKPYNQLGIESLSFHRWFRRHCTFYKIFIKQNFSLKNSIMVFALRLLLKPGSRPWKIWTLKNLDPEKPGLRKTWTLKKLDSENSELWKTR